MKQLLLLIPVLLLLTGCDTQNNLKYALKNS